MIEAPAPATVAPDVRRSRGIDAPERLRATTRRDTPAVFRYGVALGLTLTGVLLSWAFREATGESMPAPALVAVAGAWWYGGVRAGLVATILATVGIAYLVYDPIYSWEVSRGEAARLFGWAASAAAVGFVAHLLHERTDQLEDALAARQDLLNAALDAERRVDQERALFSTVFAGAPTGIGIWDADLRCLHINSKLAEMNGLPADMTLGRRPAEYMPDWWPRWQPFFEAALDGKPTLDVVMEGENLDGAYSAVSASYYPIKNGEEIVGVALVCADMTAQRAAMRSVEVSEQRYRALTDTTDAVVFTANAAGTDLRLESMGESARADAGFWQSSWPSALHPTDREAVASTWQRCVQEGTPFTAVGRLRRSDGGTYRWHEARAVPIRGASGTVREWVGTITDVDDRYRAQLELRLLAELSEHFARSLSVDEVARAVAEATVPAFADGAGAYVRTHEGVIRRVQLAYDNRETSAVEAHDLNNEGLLGAPAVLRTGVAEFYPKVTEDVLRETAGSNEHLDAMRAMGTNSLIIVPVGSEVPPIAALSFVTFDPDRTLDERDFAIAREIARRAALPLENARLHERMRTAFEAASLNLAQLRVVTDAVPALISYIDRDYRYRFNNRTYQEWFGHTPSDVQGRLAPEVLGPSAFERIKPYFDSALAGEIVEYEDYVPYATGPRWIHATYVPDEGPDGIRGFFVLVTDIGFRKRAEIEQQVLAAVGEALMEPRDLGEITPAILAAVVPAFAMEASVYAKRPDGAVERVAVQAGMNVSDQTRFQLNPDARFGPARVFATGQPEHYRLVTDEMYADLAQSPEHLAAIRELDPQSAILVPIRTRGEVTAVLVLARLRTTQPYDEADVAFAQEIARRVGLAIENARLQEETQRALADLQETANRLIEANASKDEFLSLVSHELRTPITTIMGNAEIIIRRGEAMPYEQRQGAISDVKMEAQRLSTIIENLLVLARLERGAEVEVEPLLLDRTIERVLSVARRENPERQYVFNAAESEALVSANPLYVEQVLRNLISNAEKYSPTSAPIRVHVRRGEDVWVTSIEDGGDGIAPDEVERIFDPFFRSEQTSRKAPGLGVGLAVCRRLIEIQDGQLWVESDGATGSTFSFALPAED